MAKKMVWVFLIVVCHLVTPLRAKPGAIIAPTTRNPVPVNFHVNRGHAPNSRRIPTSFNTVTNRKDVFGLRNTSMSPTPKPYENQVLTAKAGKFNDANSFSDNSPSDFTSSEKRVMEIKDGELAESQMTNFNTYNKLESDKCYLVFQKYKLKNAVFSNIYYWIGKDSSEKDAAAAASEAVVFTLNGNLGTQIYREAERHESSAFKALFDDYDYDAKLRAQIGDFEKVNGRLKRSTSAEEESSEDENRSKRVKIIEIKNEGYTFIGTDISQYQMPLYELDVNCCHLIDSRDKNVGIFVWMGSETNLELRKEAAKQAELYLRRQENYNYSTHVSFVEQENLPTLFWTVEQMINFLSDNLHY